MEILRPSSCPLPVGALHKKSLCRPVGADYLTLFLPMADAMGYVSGAATRLK